MHYQFSLEPVENVSASNEQGITVYRKEKFKTKEKREVEERRMVKATDGKEVEKLVMVEKEFETEKERDVMREMVTVIIPADDRFRWYGVADNYRKSLQTEVNDGKIGAATSLARFDKALEAFRNNTGMQQEGTSLIKLGLAKGAIERLTAAHIGSIEELAQLSDSQCQNMGMGVTRFRTMAQAYVEGHQTNNTAKLASEVQTLRDQKDAADIKHAEEMETMRKQIAALQAAATGAQPPAPAPTPARAAR